jgi:hypothetical protein
LPDYLMSFLVWHVANALRNTSVSDTPCVANVPFADIRRVSVFTQPLPKADI